MLPDAAAAIAKAFGGLDTLISEISRLSGRDEAELIDEMRSHLALRLSLLIIGELRTAGNHREILDRIRECLPDQSGDEIASLAEVFARSVVWHESSGVRTKLGLSDLPYPTRNSLFATQRHRCGVCGWSFRPGKRMDFGRKEWESIACLDHRIPMKLGGERAENLWILCGLCNTLKEATLHIGEHGRVWSNNSVFYENQRLVAFWTLRRDGRCRSHMCTNGPFDGQLFVVPVSRRGAIVVDNSRAVCIDHIGHDKPIDY